MTLSETERARGIVISVFDETLRDVDGLEGADANFTMNGLKAISEEMDPATLMDVCLEEDRRRMAGYDSRLIRPTTMPKLARFARIFIRPKRPAAR
jgi:hypothetical protein